MDKYIIPTLPLTFDVETKVVLKQAAVAHRRLAELKGAIKSMPNASILINTLALQESKDSSEIESIITTHDELYKAQVSPSLFTSAAAKEVENYNSALFLGYDEVKKNKSEYIRNMNYEKLLDIKEKLDFTNSATLILKGKEE